MINTAIQELEQLSKQGESYTDENGRFGWRNPIRHDTGKIMTALVLANNPKTILEIGTGPGLSTLYLVNGIIDKTNLSVDTLEFDPEVAQSTQDRMNKLNLPVRVIHGDASATIPTLKQCYDLVFFDAQKNKYGEQLQLLIEHKLITTGTLILADNVSDRKEECADFLNWFTTNQVHHTIIDTECGLLVARI